MPPNLPIGYDDFKAVIENQLTFVDKSLFIQEVIEDKATQAAVIVRPRRFGKTLNLSMLHYFLAEEVEGQSTDGLFDHLKITQLKQLCEQHRGKYPVIFLTFKGVKDHNYEGAYNNLCKLMSRTYLKHQEVLSSPKLAAHQKSVFESIVEERATTASIQSSLLDLTQAIYLYYGVKPWLLIDEYDTPIQSSYVHGYYEPFISLMRNIFGDVLKTNPYLHRAVITGILRVAKESLFSGVNNLEVYSLLRPEYGRHFGFTEEEVDHLLQEAQLENQSQEIKDWYNGYQAGDTILYNPWSLANCIKRKGQVEPYWVNTSDNELIKNLLAKSSAEFKASLESLLRNEPVERLMDENNETATWSLLFMAGYLKTIAKRRTSDGLKCLLTIPNEEVRSLYQQIIKQWLANGHGIEWYNTFISYLLNGHLEAFERGLRQIMEEIVSSHDMSRDPEVFYHGLMIGLTASLYQDKNYEIQSNRESGYGRYDYLILSRDPSKPTILLEFKRVETMKDIELLTARLEQAAHEALEQIRTGRYFAMAEKGDRKNIIKLGLAFCGKRFKMITDIF